jgi:hypothetical protein
LKLEKCNGGWSEENVLKELRKAELCDYDIQEFYGQDTLSHYMTYKHCNKWFCRKCGSKDGRRHKKRIVQVITALGGMERLYKLEGYTLVFTVPGSIRESFKSRKQINALKRMAVKCARKYIDCEGGASFVHLTGDKHTFNPHIPVMLIREKTNTIMKLSPEILEKIKENYKMRLKKHGCNNLDKVVVGIKFYNTFGKIYHEIDYNCKLHPGFEDLKYLMEDDSLSFLVNEMKNYPYVRYFGSINKKNIDDESQLSDLLNYEVVTKEKLIFCKPEIPLTWAIFHMRYRKENNDYEDVADGIIRINAEIWDKQKKRFIKPRSKHHERK